MPKEWKTPGGRAAAVCLDMLKQPHLLIAGSTGSGKSVLINSIIYTALYKSPTVCGFILIDPKRVELNQYRRLPHCLRYASEPDEIAATLAAAVARMDDRYKALQAQWPERMGRPDIYIIIDEFADLMNNTEAGHAAAVATPRTTRTGGASSLDSSHAETHERYYKRAN